MGFFAVRPQFIVHSKTQKLLAFFYSSSDRFKDPHGFVLILIRTKTCLSLGVWAGGREKREGVLLLFIMIDNNNKKTSQKKKGDQNEILLP